MCKKWLVRFILLSFVCVMIACDSRQQFEFKENPPDRIILFIHDGMPVGAADRVPLPLLQQLKQLGVYYDSLYVSLAAHPAFNNNRQDPDYYPWTCSLPNPVAMTGTIFIGQPGVQTQMLQHSFQEQLTAFTVNCGAYKAISPGFDIYHQMETHGWPDLFKDELSVEKAKEVILDKDPKFIRIHLQGPGSAGHIVHMGSKTPHEGHLKYAAPDGSLPWYRDLYHPDSPYVIQALKVDSLLSDFVGWLETESLSERTVMIIMGDHGQYPGGTHPPYEPLSNVTSLLMFGHGIKTGRQFTYAEIFDIGPTIAFMGSVASPKYAIGRVLQESIIGPEEDIPGKRTLREFNEVLIAYHRIMTEHPELQQNKEFLTLANQFVTVSTIGTWHRAYTCLESLLAHNMGIFKQLKQFTTG